MIILIPKDIGGVFDELSIINVKLNLSSGKTKEKNKENYDRLSKAIKDQIGEGKFIEIVGSDYYKELYNINLDLFLFIDRSKIENLSARDVDQLNYKRFLAKSKLQEFFFKNSLTEIKIGY